MNVKELIANLRGLDPKNISCDGCTQGFILDKITPVSGDYNLCDECFEEWYPEFCIKY